MELQRLDPRVITLWRLHALVSLFSFWMAASAGVAVAVGWLGPAWLGVLAGALLWLGRFAVAMAWPSLRFDAAGYLVREQDLLVQGGVIFRRRVVIPLDRIQHVDTRQGPLERALGLGTVLVYTAAGMAADGSIEGLSQQVAEALRDDLARRGGDSGV